MNQRNTHGRYRIALASAAALAITSLPAAYAADAPAARAVTVRYGDLNLGTDAGVHSLYARLARAAEQVCPDRHDRNLARASSARACQAQAMDAAIQKVQSPRLAALRAQRAGAG